VYYSFPICNRLPNAVSLSSPSYLIIIVFFRFVQTYQVETLSSKALINFLQNAIVSYRLDFHKKPVAVSGLYPTLAISVV